VNAALHNYRVQEKAFKSARLFLGHLRLSQPHWGRAPSSPWIFRGQADANWSLVPSAFRTPGKDLIKHLSMPYVEVLRKDRAKLASLAQFTMRPAQHKLLANIDETAFRENVLAALAHVAAEIHAVDEFVRLSDNVGLPIPSSRSSGVHDYLRGLLSVDVISVGEQREAWLNPALDDTFGLAQHHGVPTRLSDWTRNPLVAAFFSAQNIRGESLAVWALDTSWLSPASRIRTVTCRRYDNTFLHAQDGLFLWDSEAVPSLRAANGQRYNRRSARLKKVAVYECCERSLFLYRRFRGSCGCFGANGFL
jgi:hypothetical protein